MIQVSFPALIDALGGSGISGRGDDAFAVPSEGGFFVEPVLGVKESLSDLSADIILISARGAAGKSRTAREIAERVGAPLWMLEKDSAVGRTALPFKANSFLETVDHAAIVRSKAVKPAMLIDSLDEARSRVSAQSWEEFLDSIVEAASHGWRLILFGRDRTLEEVWLRLADAEPSLAWLEVSHFPSEAQRAYVDGRVALRGKSTDGDYYESAREAMIEALTGSVEDESAEMFVGYAPVLDAVAAVLLEEQNHFKLAQEFTVEGGASRHLDVLRELLYELLKRDQKKLEPLALELGLDPAFVYTPSEQIDWLWHDLKDQGEPALESISDPAVKYEYRKKLRPFLDDHPFRSERFWASAVFEAYATAERLDGGLPSEILVDVGNRSGLLFDLVAARSGEADVLIDEWQFAALHSSVLAGESLGSAANVSAIQGEDSLLSGSIEVNRPSVSLTLTFTLVPDDVSSIVLYGPLESLTLATLGSVRIPSSASGRGIGPDLYIRCSALRIEGNQARFSKFAGISGADEADVRFEITTLVDVLPPMIEVEPTVASFEIAVPDGTPLAYPWVKFLVALEEDDAIDAQSIAIRFLKKLQSLARTHGHSDGRATFFMKLQGRQPIKASALKRVLAALAARNVVRLEGHLVFLTPEADQHRFSGKSAPGQRSLEQEWTYWKPIVDLIEEAM